MIAPTDSPPLHNSALAAFAPRSQTQPPAETASTSSFLTTTPLSIMKTLPLPQIRPLRWCHQKSSFSPLATADEPCPHGGALIGAARTGFPPMRHSDSFASGNREIP